MLSLLAHAGHDHNAPEAMLVHLVVGLCYTLMAAVAIGATYRLSRSRLARAGVTAACVALGISLLMML
jgi:hypothetical protein